MKKNKVFENEYYHIEKIPNNYVITYKVKGLHSGKHYSFVDDGIELAKELAEYWMHIWMFEKQTGKPATHAQKLQALSLSERPHDDCKTIKVAS